MADPQPTDAHLRVAHSINEQLMVSHFSEQQRRILDLILRLSWGCGNKVAYIPHQRDFGIVGVREGHVKAHLDWLVEAKVIIRQGCYYQFNKDFDQWRVSRASGYSKEKLTEIVSINLKHDKPELTEKGSENLRNTEERTYGKGKFSTPELASPKERLKKVLNKDIIIVPDWIEKEVWDAFLEMRKNKKAASTQYALSLIIKELETFKASGDDPNEILKKSITNSWKGVFSLKGGQSGTHQRHSQKLTPRDSYTQRPPDPRITLLIEEQGRTDESPGSNELG